MTAMRLSLGLSKVADDAVFAVPAVRLLDAPLLGLAARRDIGAPLAAHRVLLLVESTEDTDCDALDDQLPPADQNFKLTYANAKCLPSDPTLSGYCDFKKMIHYRLDKESNRISTSECPQKFGVLFEHIADAGEPSSQKLPENFENWLKNRIRGEKFHVVMAVEGDENGGRHNWHTDWDIIFDDDDDDDDDQ